MEKGAAGLVQKETVQEDILDLLPPTLFVAPVLAGIPGPQFKQWSEKLKHHLPVSLAVISIGASMSVRR